MLVSTAIALASAIAAAASAAGYAGGRGIMSGTQKSQKKDAIESVRNTVASSNLDPSVKNMINTMSDSELLAMMDTYAVSTNGFWGTDWEFDENGVNSTSALLADLGKLSQFSEPMPTAPDYDALYKEAQEAINTENKEILDIYDADKARVSGLYDQQLADSNAAYNRNVEQILSNDYQKNAQLLGTMRSEMNRSQRNALEAGASAGIRIAGNVNTMLSMQNKQSQQSLETSNNLAQMLLNQQQANAGLRNEYSNYLSQDAANRAALKSGTAERVENYYGNRVNTEQFKYDTAEDEYNKRYTATVGASNPFANTYQNYYRNSQYNTAK